MKEIPLKVELPFGERYSVTAICGNVEHIGNRVAEGDLHPSQFWPELARLATAQKNHDAARHYRDRDARERKAYSDNWVCRYMAQMEAMGG